ncbi:multidrug efflux SMR transporter [Melioribacteraceae bacterium 4301-Me]|uniref:DMT family transporter n=1 Tax=Pyranulibacter aquaticus TaxID=3163344 RepID=UPI003595B0E4
MSWLYIFIASIFEITWAVGLKYSQGFTQIRASILTVVSMILTYVFLAFGVKNLPIGTAYAVWTGLGIIGTSIYGMIYFDEPKDILRILFILLIFIGVIGLHLTTKSNP